MIGWIVAAFVAGGIFGVVVMALAAANGEGTEKSDVPRDDNGSRTGSNK